MDNIQGGINPEPPIRNVITDEIIHPLRILPPSPGTVTVLINDGVCFALQEVGEDLLDDDTAFLGYLQAFGLQLRDKLYEIRQQRNNMLKDEH